MQNKKSLPNRFITVGNSTAMQVVHIEYGKIIRTSQKGFVYKMHAGQIYSKKKCRFFYTSFDRLSAADHEYHIPGCQNSFFAEIFAKC